MTPPVDQEKQNVNRKKKTKKLDKSGITKTRQKKHQLIKCPICFAKFDEQSRVSSTNCGHVFCTSCIETALGMRSVCPICRKKLRRSNAHHPLYLDYGGN